MESPTNANRCQTHWQSTGGAHVRVRCCMWWTPHGALDATPVRPALPQPRSEHEERPELRMAYAYRRSRVLLHLNPPGGAGLSTGTRRHPKVPLDDTALCPGPRCHQETRDSGGPHAGRRSSLNDRAWRKRKAGNEPTSLGVTPHGVRDPAPRQSTTTTERHSNRTRAQRREKALPNPIDQPLICH